MALKVTRVDTWAVTIDSLASGEAASFRYSELSRAPTLRVTVRPMTPKVEVPAPVNAPSSEGS